MTLLESSPSAGRRRRDENNHVTWNRLWKCRPNRRRARVSRGTLAGYLLTPPGASARVRARGPSSRHDRPDPNGPIRGWQPSWLDGLRPPPPSPSSPTPQCAREDVRHGMGKDEGGGGLAKSRWPVAVRPRRCPPRPGRRRWAESVAHFKAHEATASPSGGEWMGGGGGLPITHRGWAGEVEE